MNTPLENYFDKILVLNLARRVDRMSHFSDTMASIGVTEFARVDGYDKPADSNGIPSGNKGCTESHRRILEIIAYHRWERVLVMEDDATVRPDFASDFHIRFEAAMKQLPDDALITYLGGGYADTPKRRVSEYIIQVSRMLTTSSYIIGWRMAEAMAPFISGVGPIDNLFGEFTARGRCYCVSPRLFVQYTSMSDLTDREVNYEMSMTDSRHEEMLIAGEWVMHGEQLALKSKLFRRELAARHDMDGETVVVDGQPYGVVRVILPDHLPPWFRNEPVTYILERK